MSKIYKLPDTLFAKRIAPLILDFEVIRAEGVRLGRVTLACGHVRHLPNVLTAPPHGARVLCPTCTGQAETRQPAITQKGWQPPKRKRRH